MTIYDHVIKSRPSQINNVAVFSNWPKNKGKILTVNWFGYISHKVCGHGDLHSFCDALLRDTGYHLEFNTLFCIICETKEI